MNSSSQGSESHFSSYATNINTADTNLQDEGEAPLYGPTTGPPNQPLGLSSYSTFYTENYPIPPNFMMGEQNSQRNFYAPRPLPGIGVGHNWEDHHRQDGQVLYPPRQMFPIPWGNSFPGNPLSMRPRQPKPKRPRMSLQKRLLVNARERDRMRVLNKAFESLRDALPCYIADGHMAKITTLRLAINYIKALSDLLNDQRAIGGGTGKSVMARTERTHEDIFSTILKDSKVEGVKPVLKNLNERLAITNMGHLNRPQQGTFEESFPSVIQYY